MTKSIYLDPKNTAPFEPFEGDSRNGSWISSFDVPKVIHLWGDSKGFRTIKFEYAGGETGDERGLLDDQENPSIQIRAGRHTGKILELNFGSPILQSELPRIGARIARQADLRIALATKFNFQMIARIFTHWIEVVELPD